jgi:threonine/homoserine/homoserine lactone efflux protein
MPAISRPVMTQLTFVFLQVADVITTMTALASGGTEQNPLISRFLTMGTLQGLILSKVVVLAAAAAAVRLQRMRAIRWANIVFGAIVLWNVSMLVLLAWRSR